MPEIEDWCNHHNIQSSIAATCHNNELAESKNAIFKKNLIEAIIKSERRTNSFKIFRQIWPAKYKYNQYKKPERYAAFQKMFFKSHYFQNLENLQKFLDYAIKTHNLKNNKYSKFNRLEEETLNKNIITIFPVSVESSSLLAPLVRASNEQAYNLVQSTRNIIENKNLQPDLIDELHEAFCVIQGPLPLNIYLSELLANVPEEQRPLIKMILVLYADQQNSLYNTNQKLLQQLEYLQNEHKKARAILEELRQFKRDIEAERKLKEDRRAERLNRERKPPTQPFRYKYFKHIFKYIESPHNDFGLETKSILKITITLMALTGVRISELRGVTVTAIFCLLFRNYFPIKRLKRGRGIHHAFMPREAKPLLKKNQKRYHIYLTKKKQ